MTEPRPDPSETASGPPADVTQGQTPAGATPSPHYRAVAEEVRQRLGLRAMPEPGSPAYLELIGRLERSHPDLADRLDAAAWHEEDDAFEPAPPGGFHLRTLAQRLLWRPSRYSGEPVLNKARLPLVLAFLGVLVVGAYAAWYYSKPVQPRGGLLAGTDGAAPGGHTAGTSTVEPRPINPPSLNEATSALSGARPLAPGPPSAPAGRRASSEEASGNTAPLVAAPPPAFTQPVAPPPPIAAPARPLPVAAPVPVGSVPPAPRPPISGVPLPSAPPRQTPQAIPQDTGTPSPFGGPQESALPGPPPAGITVPQVPPAPRGPEGTTDGGPLRYLRPPDAAADRTQHTASPILYTRATSTETTPQGEAAPSPATSATRYTRPQRGGPDPASAPPDALFYRTTRPGVNGPSAATTAQPGEAVPPSAIAYLRPQATSAPTDPAQAGSSPVPGAPQAEGSGVTGSSTAPATTSGASVTAQTGQVVQARLVTAVETYAGRSVPVLAQSPEGTWLGTATLDAGLGRFQLAFDRLVRDGRASEVSALAYDGGYTQGLAAPLRDVAPSLAQDLVRNGLSALNSYAQGLAGAGTTTYGGGTATTTQTGAPLSALIAGALGQTFTLPPNTQSFVRVARLERGTPLLLVLGLSDAGR